MTAGGSVDRIHKVRAEVDNIDTVDTAHTVDRLHKFDRFVLEQDDDGDGVGAARIVRPYTVTGGRTRVTGRDLPLEALVQTVVPRPDSAPTSMEPHKILDLCQKDILSVAEVSAHLHLPLGVVRVLIGDLAAAGFVLVHNAGAVPAAPVNQLAILESVLNGISQL